MAAAAILKNENRPYLRNGSTDLRKIWYDDAFWASETDRKLKFPTFENRQIAISPERFDRSSPNLVRWCIFASEAERKLKFLTFRSTIIATISITFPDSTKYQMTRYDVTVSNFLLIADCCIMRTFIMRIVRIFCFLKNTYVFLRILFYHTRILELWPFRLAKIRLLY